MKASDTVTSACRLCSSADNQAEISFKAGIDEGYKRGLNMKPNPDGVYDNGFRDGRRAGIKEVVEWMVDCGANFILDDEVYPAWQSKLKEWGCL